MLRVFQEYAAGRSLPQIIEGLNRDNIPAPTGGLWKRTALAGSPKKRESEIRAVLLREIGAIELSGDIERQRVLFKRVLKSATLTPILGQYSGETVDIALREEGWPEFWRNVASDK